MGCATIRPWKGQESYTEEETKMTKKMTVQELMELLAKYDGDTVVVLCGFDDDACIYVEETNEEVWGT